MIEVRSQDVLVEKARELIRRERSQRCLEWGVVGAFYSLLACLLLAVVGEFADTFIVPWLAYGLVVGAGTGFGVVLGWARKSDAKKHLIDADRKLQLRERLSTAWEVFARETGFARLLMDDAAAHARGLRAVDVYPHRIPPRTAYLPFLIVAIVALSVFDLPFGKPMVSQSTGDPAVAEEAKELAEFGEELAKRAEEHSFPESMRIAEQLQELGESLQSEELDREQSSERISEYAEQLGVRIEELTERAMARQDSSETGRERLQEMIGTLSDQGTDALGDEEGESDQRDSTTQPGDPGGPRDGEDRALRQDEEPVSPDESDTELDDLAGLMAAADRLQEALESLQTGPERITAPSTVREEDRREDATGESFAEAARVTDGKGDAEEEAHSDAPGSESSGLPGDMPVRDEKGERIEVPRKSQSGDPTQLKADSQALGAVQALVRSLPRDAQSVLLEETAVVDYEKQVEMFIAKEDVPSHYRESTRDYFLRIGAIGENGP